MYSDYKIVFDGEGSWSFNNDSARNVVILVLIIVLHLTLRIVRMKDLLIIIRATLALQRNVAILIFAKFCYSFHYDGVNSSFLVNGKNLSVHLFFNGKSW